MNETAKHDDIEDVLSSIRRLVSDSAGLDRRDMEPVAERLMLTPALRVAETEDRHLSPVLNGGDDAADAPWNADSDATTDAPPMQLASEDESWPERPVVELPQDDVGEEEASAQDAPESGLNAALRRVEAPFGLSAFTTSIADNEAFRETRDVVMFRSPSEGVEHTEVSETSEAPEAVDNTTDLDAVVEEFSADSLNDTTDEPMDEVVDTAPDEAAADMAADDETPAEQPDSAAWPMPDAAVDGPVLDEPEAWSLRDDAADAVAEATDDAVHEETLDADELGGEDVASSPETFVAVIDEAPELGAYEAPDLDAYLVSEDTAEAQETGDASDEPQFHETDDAVEEMTDPQFQQTDETPQPEAESMTPPDTDEAAEPDTLPDHTILSNLPNVDLEVARNFEPEHGDTDWSDTDSVQPALDIAAARQARGEEITPDPAAVPQSMPIFARSRRRPMTSLDDLITPETESETVADAVSQAMADGALDRAEGGVPEETDAKPQGGNGIADEAFDLETSPGDDLDMIDEEALRDLIAQVVREELQGALGQRITRNVRKMVRREIRLALAAQEFE